jgi:hypothetical protein
MSYNYHNNNDMAKKKNLPKILLPSPEEQLFGADVNRCPWKSETEFIKSVSDLNVSMLKSMIKEIDASGENGVLYFLNQAENMLSSGTSTHVEKLLKMFAKAHPAIKTFHRYHWCLGGALEHQGKNKQAVAAYSRAIDIEPHDIGYYAIRGQLRESIGDPAWEYDYGMFKYLKYCTD